MEYKVKRSDDLEHGLFGNVGAKLGSTWEKHKYIAKQKAGDGYRYFYSQAELAAAKAKQTGQKIAKTAKTGTQKVASTAKAGVASVKRTAKKASDVVSGKYINDVDSAIAKKKSVSTAGNKIHGVAYNQYWDAKNQLETNRDNMDAATIRKLEKQKNDAHEILNRNWDKAYKNYSDYKDAERARDRDSAYQVSKKIQDTKEKIKAVSDKIKKTTDVITGKYAKDVDSKYDRYDEDLHKRWDKDLDQANRKWAAYDKGDEKAYKNADEAGKKSSEVRKQDLDALSSLGKEKLTKEYKLSKSISNSLREAELFIDKGKKAASKFLSNAKEAGGNALNIASDKVKGLANKGKSAVSKFLSYSSDVDKKAEAYDQASTRAGNQKKYDVAEKLQNKANEAEEEKSSFKYKASKAISSTPDALNKGKAAASKLFSSAKSTADNVVKEAGKQVDLAKNAVDEAKWERALKNSINTQQNKLDDIDKKISNYHKKADKDPEYAENNAGYIEALAKERDSVSKELARVRNQYIDWTNGDKYWYELTPGSSKTKKVTSTERKDRIKNR